MKKIVFLFFILTNFCFSQIDSTVFCLSNKGVPGLYLAKVNTVTGLITHISPTVIGGGVLLASGSTIDPYNEIYYFGDQSNYIIGLDLVTGTIVTSAPITNTNTTYFDQMIFNPSDSIIYGLARNFSPPAVYLAKISPVTGIVTKISTFSLSNGEMIPNAVIDPFTKTFYYVNENRVIIGIDMASGNATSSVTITNANADDFDQMEFNISDKNIYGIARKGGPPSVFLAKINPTTGVVTNISATSLSTGEQIPNSLIDPCNNVYYYISENGCVGASCGSGTIVSSTPTTDQVLAMKFNYKCALSFISFAGIKENTFKNRLKISPNPSSSILNIFAQQKEFENTEIEITNTLGQTVLKSPFANQIDISKLSQGFYNLKITSQNGQINYSKFVKE